MLFSKHMIILYVILFVLISLGVKEKLFQEDTHVCFEEEKPLDLERCIGELSPAERTCYTKWNHKGRNFCSTGWRSLNV